MGISTTRWIFRGFLVLILLGVVFLGVKNYLRGKASHHWDEAQAALNQTPTDRKAAMHHLRILVNRERNHLEGNRELARLYLEEAQDENPSATYADVPRAMRHLMIAAALDTSNEELQRTLLKAQLLSGDLFSATTAANRLIQLDPTDNDAMFTLAYDDIDKQRYRTAENRIQEMEKLEQQPRFRTLALKAHLYNVTRNAEGMKQTIDAFVEKARNMSVAQLAALDIHERRWIDELLARAVRESTDISEAQVRASDAMTVLTKLLEAEKDDPEKVRKIAEAGTRVTLQLAAKRQEQQGPRRRLEVSSGPAERNVAAKMANIGLTAIDMEQGTPLIYHQTAEALVTLQHYSRAMDVLNMGLETDKESVTYERDSQALLDLHRRAASLLAYQKRFNEANEHVQTLLDNEDTAGLGHMIAGRIDFGAGRYEEALEHFLEARKIEGETLGVRSALAATYMELRRYPLALEMLRTLEVEEPERLEPEQRRWREVFIGDNEMVSVLMIQAHLEMGDADEANHHMRLLFGSEREPEALALLYDFLLEKFSNERAYAFLMQARQRFPENEELFQRDIQFLESAQEFELAGRRMEMFYSESEDPEDLLRPIDYYLDKRQYRQALNYVDRMIAQRPEDVALLQAKAALLNDRRLYDEQLEVLERVRRLMPDSATPYYLKAELYREISKYREAIEELQKGLVVEPEDEKSRLLRIELLLDANQFEAVKRETAALLNRNAAAWEAYFSRAKALAGLNQHDQAIELLEQLKEMQKKIPRAPRVYAELANLYTAVNQPAKAMEVIRLGYEAVGEREDLKRAHIQVLVRADNESELKKVCGNSPDAWFWQAESWSALNRADRAVRSLQQALQIDRDHTDSRLMLARIRFAQNQFEAATAHASAVLRRYPQEFDALLLKAQAQMRMGQREDAIESLLRVVREDPKRVQAFLALADIVLADLNPDQKDIDAAVGILRRGMEAMPNDLALVQRLVELMVRFDRRDELDDVAPNNPEVHFYKAQALRNRNYLEEARGETERVLKLNADHYGARLMAVEVNLALDAYESALTHADEALRRHGPMWDFVQLKARTLSQMGRYEDAVALLDDLIKEQPTNINAYSALSRIHREEENIDEAVAALDRGLEERPNNPTLTQQKIALFVDEERLEDLDNFRPESADVSYLKALAWRGRNRLDRAMIELERFLEEQPDHLPARVMAAEIALVRGDNDAALTHAIASNRQDPRLVNGRLIRADALRRMGRRSDAIDLLKALIDDRPRMPVAYSKLAGIYRDLEDYDNALKYIRQGRVNVPNSLALAQLEIQLLAESDRMELAERSAEALGGEEPSFSIAHSVARAYHNAEKYDLAREWAEKALELADDMQDAQAHTTLGQVLQAAGLDQEDEELLKLAREQFEIVLEDHEYDITAGNNLAWLLSEEFGQPEEALKVIERVRGDSEPELLPVLFVDTIAGVYRKLQRYQDALELVQTALAIHPNDAKLHYQLGMVHVALKQTDEARKELERALDLGLEDEKLEAEVEATLRTLNAAARADTTPPEAAPEKPANDTPPAPKPADDAPGDEKPAADEPVEKEVADDKPAAGEADGKDGANGPAQEKVGATPAP